MATLPNSVDVIVIGAGGAGLMCATEAASRGRSVLVLDHADKVGKKILISGGGRCNFTNTGAKAECYVSGNPHFCKSAFGQYTQHDFVASVEAHHIAYHEKKLGQLFCDKSAQQIVDMLVGDAERADAHIVLSCAVTGVDKQGDDFVVVTPYGGVKAQSVVVACGGLSIPKIGATDFGYRIAKQFGLKLVAPEPALVPFTFSQKDLGFYEGLSGISLEADVTCGKVTFRENILITHRGVSGPAILQISSYWHKGDDVYVHMLPTLDWSAHLKDMRTQAAKQELKTILGDILPKRLVNRVFEMGHIQNMQASQLSDKDIRMITDYFTKFKITPNGTEGFRKAEVTRGGVHTSELDARTLEAKKIPGLYFVGEVVDVTGWLGGYNFQWAWSSGYAAGQSV